MIWLWYLDYANVYFIGQKGLTTWTNCVFMLYIYALYVIYLCFIYMLENMVNLKYVCPFYKWMEINSIAIIITLYYRAINYDTINSGCIC